MSFLLNPVGTPSNQRKFAQHLVLCLLSALFLVTGCKKDVEIEPTPVNNTLTANAGADQETQVGQVVTLDGSSSKDSENKSFTFQWAILRKPAKSQVTLAGATTAKPTFTPDEVGEYELELTVANANGKSTDKVLVTAAVSQPVTINQNISVRTVLTDRIANPELPDYIVARSVAVTAELTINPGVVIAFERDTRMDINDNGGIIIAKGEPNKRIRFMGVEKTKGYWVGIMVYSGSNANVFENIDVMHTGSRFMLSGIKAGMGLFGSSKAQIALKNSVFSDNDGYGLYVQEGSILREFATNTFRNHTEAGILIDAVNVPKLDVTSVFTGNNGRNVVEIMSSVVKGGKDDEIVWKGFADKTPYRMTGILTINAGWKLEPDVTIEMARDAEIRVDNSAYLIARGTPTEKITITGVSRTPGYWRGLISYSTSAQNVIEYAEISNAGSLALVSGKKANIALYGAKSTMSIKNAKISGSAGHGIYVGYGSVLNNDAATANTFENNGAANVMIDK
ncbi:right-handed parallel beta-helix repeat-containing protein [Spirosoma taeanense]|uniref:Right-handed parallel beta-helix repeat-containing protein n=1 Tax=Spirosoma taeanense TaxID=2735870 RepID=A0A6M5YEA0_9BACT|nr:right-handed parallel beta-helix repeat-containing protein [Spirosoma taeanense]